MRKKLAVILAIVLLFVCGAVTVSASENTTYTYTISVNDSWIRTQDAYMPGTIYMRNLGLSNPEDMFMVGKTIYVTDTDNSRIVVYNIETDESWSFGTEILNKPRGVFVTENGDIYVADKEDKSAEPDVTNEVPGAVFIFDKEGNYKSKISRPVSYLFSDLSQYKPKNVVVTSEGNIFVCGEGSFEGLMQFDMKGEFQGYFAANKKYLTVMETLEDMILSDEMKQDMVMRRPRPIQNLDVTDRDLVYTITQTDEISYAWKAAAAKNENCVKLHNLAGVNILSRDKFMADEWNFVDIASGPYGNSFAVTPSGLIYEYDSNGDLVFSFAGKAITDERSGIFTSATAIEADNEGFVYVLDKAKAFVQVFYPTDFAVWTHQAIYDLERGDYENSEQTWSNVLKLNGMARIAHMGYGKTLFHQQRFEEALEEFRFARNREYYSDAFWELRDEWMSNNMLYFLIVGVLLIAYVIVSSIIKKRRPAPAVAKVKEVPKTPGKRLWHDLTYFTYMVRHPIDGYYYLKRHQAGSVLSATILYFVIFAVYLADTVFRGFIFGFAAVEETPIAFMSIIFFAVVALFVIGNYMVASINEGEGSFRNIYVMLPYALTPYMIITPFVVGSTYVLTQNEAFLVTLAWTIALLWSAALIFIGLNETHNYSFTETLKNVILTLFFMVIAVIAMAVLYLLWVQVITFFQDVIQEVSYRVQNA